MKVALKKLAEFMDDPSLASRNPLSSMSFSCLPPDVVKSQTDSLVFHGRGQKTAFSPLGSDGRPLRKYAPQTALTPLLFLIRSHNRRFSDRKREHWFHGEKDGLSYAGLCISHVSVLILVFTRSPLSKATCSWVGCNKNRSHLKSSFPCRNPNPSPRKPPKKGGCAGQHSLQTLLKSSLSKARWQKSLPMYLRHPFNECTSDRPLRKALLSHYLFSGISY